ncbi:glycoside hydrolase family 5 protein [Cellulomonas olei]|uniref:glycoside hydrolase family 5 protein n=1 Tax=Cellulomonas sp. P4 TaxID=3142533 RepID=UPI0031BB3FFA
MTRTLPGGATPAPPLPPVPPLPGAWPPADPAAARGQATFTDVVRVDAGHLVDGDGRRLLLRGVGLGNWHLPEGYMWLFSDGGPASPREIEALVVDLVGPGRAARFWERFRDEFVTQEDVRWIAAAGFDHVRLPLNARYLLDDDGAVRPDAFALPDRLVDWCREAGLWVVLDLHGAPGGQTGTNIDDSEHGRPALFEDDEHRRRTVALWTAIARHYADEPVVAGYDLLNEPLPHEWQHRYPDRLVALYRELTTAIREVDTRHVLIYEGTHWATNWDIFTQVWDPQSMLQFHKYWSPPDRPGIEGYLRTGAGLGLPVYMGEGGENNPDWLATAFGMYDDLGVSWCFWTWKKVGTLTSPLSVDPPAGWDEVLAYASGRAPRPGADDAWATLQALLEALAPSRCTPRPEVVRALQRRPPLSLPAVAYGFRPGDHAFATPAAEPVLRRDEGAPIELDGGGEPDFDLVGGRPGDVERRLSLRLADGDRVAYRVRVPEPVTVTVRVRGHGATPDLRLDAEPGPGEASAAAPATAPGPAVADGDDAWIWTVHLPAGGAVLHVVGGPGGTRVRRVEVG